MSFTIKDLHISSLLLSKPFETYLGMTRVGDLSREAILASLRECDLSVLKDEVIEFGFWMKMVSLRRDPPRTYSWWIPKALFGHRRNAGFCVA